MQVMFAVVKPLLYQVKLGKRAIYLDTDAETTEARRKLNARYTIQLAAVLGKWTK